MRFLNEHADVVTGQPAQHPIVATGVLLRTQSRSSDGLTRAMPSRGYRVRGPNDERRSDGLLCE